jgi:hypothetical protein
MFPGPRVHWLGGLELGGESLWLWTCTLHAARFLMEKGNKYISFDSLLTLMGR